MLHASLPTGKPWFFPEVPFTMMCGVMSDTVPLRYDFFVVAIIYIVCLERSCGHDLNVLKKYLQGHLDVTRFIWLLNILRYCVLFLTF